MPSMKKEQDRLPSFDWDEKTEETEAPKVEAPTVPKSKSDDFRQNIDHIRAALRNRPTEKGYWTLIDMLLDRLLSAKAADDVSEDLLDQTSETVIEFKKWKRSNK